MEWLAPVIVSVVAALGGWVYNRHRPKVDRDATYITGSNQLIDQLQEELAVVRSRVDRLEESNEQLRGEVRTAKSEVSEAKVDAHESRNAAEQAITENIAWEGHHMTIVREHVATLRKPWPPIPVALQHRITHEEYPALPVVPDDAVPDPADDGQDKDPTT